MKREWTYFWGVSSSGDAFHFAKFFHSSKSYFHCSFNSTFFEGKGEEGIAGRFFFQSPYMSGLLRPNTKTFTIIESQSYIYKTTPLLFGNILFDNKVLPVVAWCDEEKNDEDELDDWEWVGGNVGNKIFFLFYNKPPQPFGRFMTRELCFETTFSIQDDSITINNLNHSYHTVPITPSVIFSPKNGRRYAEQFFNLFLDDTKVGVCVKEATYKTRRLD